jgi:WD40 repeat protein
MTESAGLGGPIRTLQGHAGAVMGCAVSDDGSFLVSASADGTLRIWDPQSGAERGTITGHAGPVTDCAISADGRYIVSASQDLTLRIWDPSAQRES